MLRVIKAGVLSSIQDLGREGFRHLGIAQSGCLDPMACKLANSLLGNKANDAVIEITIGLAEFEFTAPCNFALMGGDLHAKLNGMPIYPGWHHYAKQGDVLRFATSKTAQRCYLAVEGSFEINKVMGSYSTDLQAQFGGLHGKALQSGDQLSYKAAQSELKPQGAQLPEYQSRIRIMKGPHLDLLPDSYLDAFLSQSWTVSELSNRMGARLNADSLLSHDRSIASQGVHPGVIQLPPTGTPIVLLNDCQTTGGYPIIGSVIQADLRHFSQLGAGQTCQFQLVDAQQARAALCEQQHHINKFNFIYNNNV